MKTTAFIFAIALTYSLLLKVAVSAETKAKTMKAQSTQIASK